MNSFRVAKSWADINSDGWVDGESLTDPNNLSQKDIDSQLAYIDQAHADQIFNDQPIENRVVYSVLPYTGNPIKTVEVWFRAFIPNDTVSTVRINEGAYAGSTGVDLAFPFDLADPFVHLDDQRTFSNDPKASSRASAYLKFDAITGQYYTEGTTAGSTSISGLTGAVYCNSQPNAVKSEIDTLNFIEDEITSMTFGPRNQVRQTTGSFSLDASASNHCANTPVKALVPEIDFEGKLLIQVIDNTEYISDGSLAYIQLNGVVDDFPAYEVLVSIDGEEPIDIMRRGTGDNTPLGLFFDAGQEFTAEAFLARDQASSPETANSIN